MIPQEADKTHIEYGFPVVMYGLSLWELIIADHLVTKLQIVHTEIQIPKVREIQYDCKGQKNILTKSENKC